MEEQVYRKQVTKESVSMRVIDEKQVDRHFKRSDLKLYEGDEMQPVSRPEYTIPEDNVLHTLLQKFDLIHRYHEHESLLLNSNEVSLSREEKHEAWDDFEDLTESSNALARFRAANRKNIQTIFYYIYTLIKISTKLQQ